MAVPRISVVVPFYNNADQLGDCLASIAAQSMAELEVIMVDDGSTDGSADIAAAQAEADSRFTLLRKPNGGPGSARNHGTAAATGEFLAFVDADDLLPADAYSTLLGVLETSGSDFACGGVLRLTPAGFAASGLHDQAIRARRLGTHISRAPELCYDISVWNKLFRKSFWDASGLSFPEGMLWEDLVAMTKAHVLAHAVDVITDPVYYWRDRDKGAPSITQSRTSISNFRDRVTALGMIDDFLREGSNAALLRRHQRKALVNDLWLYVRDLPQTSAEYQREFITLAGSYLRQVDKRVLAAQPTTRKLAYYLMAQDRLADLVGFASWLAENPGRTPPMVRSFGRLRADLPLRRAPAERVPAAIFRPRWRELDPYVSVDSISWQGRTLVVEGSAYVPSMDISHRRSTSKVVLLVPRSRTRPPILLPARSVRRPDVTDASGQRRYSYDWSGFRCEVSPRWFGAGKKWLTGDWDCYVLVRGRAVWRPARLYTPDPPTGQPPAVQIAPGVNLGAYWAGRRLRIRLSRGAASASASAPQIAADAPAPAVVEQAWTSDGKLVLRGTLSPLPEPAAYQVVLRHLDGFARHVIAIPRADDPSSPGGADPTNPDATDPSSPDATGPSSPDATGPSSPDGTGPSSPDGTGPSRPDGIDPWTPGSGGPSTPADADPSVSRGARLAGSDRRVRHSDRFSVEVPVAAMDVFGDLAPLRDGRWAIGLRSAGPDGPSAIVQPIVPASTDSRPRRTGQKIYRCAIEPDDGLVLRVGPALSLFERGRIRRRLLRDGYYRLQRRLPLREAILFVSFDGHSCTDNPLAIAEELRRRGDRREQIWAVRDWSVRVPAGATPVLFGTAAYFAALGRSRYLIANDHLAQPYRRRPGQRYVQTWHGTPLKRIGYDIVNPTFASGSRFFDFMAYDVAQWDLLISPNPFSTPIMRRAFKFTGEIGETGYPRNDALLAAAEQPDPDRVRRIRRRLGLPDAKRVAMYVPTWRDDQHDGTSRYRFDLRLDLAAARRRLADDYVLLIRGHHLMAGWELAAAEPGFAFDVTEYPDINDLLGVTDVLITDYSSVRFDFAPTGRPMLFFTYDLEQYRDHLRGFYFDFEAAAPGPLLATSEQVVDALADLDAVAAGYRQAHDDFTARFCPLDDGKASARACDRIFKG